MKFSKVIVVFVILLNVIFTGVVLTICAFGQSEPTALIGSWFAFTTVELWNLKDIKKSEVSGVHEDSK